MKHRAEDADSPVPNPDGTRLEEERQLRSLLTAHAVREADDEIGRTPVQAQPEAPCIGFKEFLAISMIVPVLSLYKLLSDRDFNEIEGA